VVPLSGLAMQAFLLGQDVMIGCNMILLLFPGKGMKRWCVCCPSRRPPVVRQPTVKQGWLSPVRAVEGGCSTARMPKSKSQGRVSDAHHPSDPLQSDPPRSCPHGDGEDARMLWSAGVAQPRCVNSSLRWDEPGLPSGQRLLVDPA